MASLTGSTIASSYLTLLKLTSAALGSGSSAKYIEDAAGTDSALSISTTRVGIGTSSPVETLQVAGAIKVTGAVAADTADSGAIGYQSNKFRFISWGADGSTQGTYSFEGFASDGSPNSTYLILDANSRISLSNNDGGSTSGVDSTTGNTIFGYLAGAAVDSDVINNTLFGHKAGNAINAGDGNTLIGSQTGDALTTGLNNTFIGREAGSATTDVDLAVIIGYGAGAAIMTGGGGADQSTAVGSSASAALTSGQANTALGYSTLATNQTSDFNTAVGHQSLQTLQVADLGRNTAVGINTLNALATGVENTVIGAFAGDAMAVGESYNVAIGSDTMGAVDEGSGNANYNVAIGPDALKGGDLGSNGDLIGNIAIGALALDATGTTPFTGSIAIGHQALTAQTANSESVAIGYQAGLANQTGSKNVLVGYQTGVTFTDMDNCTLVGYKAGNAISHNNADGSTFIGYNAGVANTTGDKNTYIGLNAGLENTTGGNNTIVGANSYIDTGNVPATEHNTFIGANAANGTWTTSVSDLNTGVGSGIFQGAMNDASANSALGYNALQDLTHGDSNVAVGGYAAKDLTQGSNNTAVGYRALALATVNATGNVAIGKDAIYGNIISEDVDNMVGIGISCLGGALESEASGTIAIGASALAALTVGAGNVAVGYQALQDNVDGSKCTAIGYQALKEFEADTLNHGYNTVVGYDAGREMTTGNYNVIVGTEACVSMTTGDSNTIIGSGAFSGANGDEDDNVIIGHEAGANIDNGNQNVCIGSDAVPSTAAAANQVVIGYGTTGQADNSVTLGNAGVTNVYMSSDAGATVRCGAISIGRGISDPNSGTLLHLDGSADDREVVIIEDSDESVIQAGDTLLALRFGGDEDCTGGFFLEFKDQNGAIGDVRAASGGTSVTHTSDYRLKENMSDISGGLEKINKLKPILFNYIAYPDAVHEGFLAHEVQEAGLGYSVYGEKDAVKIENKPSNKDFGKEVIDRQHMANENLIPQMVNAIQELSAKVEELEAKLK